MIIAVDFDGTIVTHKYPEIGQPIRGAIETLKTVIKNDHKVFLWTVRGNKRCKGRDLLSEAIDYCHDNGLDLCGANCSPSQFSSSPKQHAHIYIDDRAIGCPLKLDDNGNAYVDWRRIGLYLITINAMTEEQYNEIWNG